MVIATVGTSWITEKFISACAYSGKAKVKYCFSRDARRASEFAAKTGAEKGSSSFDEIASDSEVDAVYIASPNAAHCGQSRFFLTHGKSVLCEKPATTTLAEYLETKELADNNGLKYAEAIMSIHTPGFDVLQKAVTEVGEVRGANIVYCQLSSKYPAFLEGKNPNIFNPEMHAGCLMDIGVYNLYLAAALFGMPGKVTSDAVFLNTGADACGSATLTYPDKTVNLVYSKTAQGFAPSEIYGDKGTILIDSVSQCQGIRLAAKDAQDRELVPGNISRDEIMSGEIAFFDALLSGEPQALKKYEFADECTRTVRTVCDEIRRQNAFRF